MSWARASAWVVAVGALGFALGCSSQTSLSSACAPGQVVSCACSGANTGLMTCLAQGDYGACRCPDGGVDGATGGRGGAAGGSAGGSAENGGRGGTAMGGAAAGAGGASGGAGGGGTSGSADPTPTGCVASGKLIGGKEPLIDVFVADAGILVVRNDAILLIGRDRAIKQQVMAPRPILSASFDGTSLVVADAAMLTVYGPDLQSRGTVLLTEACASSVLLDGGIFVCGPQNDWDRIFYTYDINALKPIARSSKTFTYHGRPMKRVLGTSYFITVSTDSSPSDFYLYKVLPGGSDVVYVNESPYHGDFAATTVMGFDATPATHLINSTGLMLRIFGDGCDGQATSLTSGCFVKDGALGTLAASTYFFALENDREGRLFAVTNQTPNIFSYNPLCPGGCNVQLIDVAKRSVVSQRTHLLASRRFVALRPDKACRMVALAYELATSSFTVDYAGYQVDLVDYGESAP